MLESGHIFYTQSDTEVLIHLYEQYGNRMVEHINGMFSFAIWDSINKKIFIARDRIGGKAIILCNN